MTKKLPTGQKEHKKIALIVIVSFVAVMGLAYGILQLPSVKQRVGHCRVEYFVCTGQFVGLDEKSAKQLADSHGLSPRVVRDNSWDGPQAITADNHANRINFVIQDNIVTDASFDDGR